MAALEGLPKDHYKQQGTKRREKMGQLLMVRREAEKRLFAKLLGQIQPDNCRSPLAMVNPARISEKYGFTQKA